MPNPITYPNQRTIHINRVRATSDFLGIKNDNWKAAARSLGAHAFLLYIYLASNADGFNLALSPAAIEAEIGMPRSTYHDQFRRLVNFGYLVEAHGNTYEFYETPQTSGVIQSENSQTAGVIPMMPADKASTNGVNNVVAEDIEINKNKIQKINIPNNESKQSGFNVYTPKVVEVTIKDPQREPMRKRRR